jgi:ABC-type nitrate/sulfonate/bicarbonate transport system substrate-binding protein
VTNGAWLGRYNARRVPGRTGFRSAPKEDRTVITARHRLLVGLLVGVLAACTSAATPAATPAPATPAATAAGSAGPSAAPDGTLPKPEVSSITIGGAVQEPSQFAAKLAQMLGYFDKYGLKVDFVTTEGEANTVAALFSGAVQVATAGGGNSLNSLLTDNPIRHFGLAKVKVIDGLFCNQDIKTAADLKGKQVAISSLGGVPHASVLLALEALKLQPSDIQTTNVGAQATRLAALKSGAVACAPIGMDLEQELKGLGFNVLVDLSKTDLEYPSNGPFSTVTWLDAHPNTALVILAAMLEAQNLMFTKPAEAAAKWAEFAQVDIADAQTRFIVDVPKQLNRSFWYKDSAFEFPQKVIAIVNPAIASVDAKKAHTREFLQKLIDIGFYDKIGSPRPN